MGSSPLTRGKHHSHDGVSQPTGLIPAHAGKTDGPGGELLRLEAHPRSRGENIDGDRATAEEWGSSPLTRGKRQPHQVAHITSGLIPAHAGKTSFRSLRRSDRRAHPRSRGENLKPARAASARTGSSPLTRGKPHPGSPTMRIHGLIPAHAGKTITFTPVPQDRRAHPRSRGENRRRRLRAAQAAGSSPLTRGKPQIRQNRR